MVRPCHVQTVYGRCMGDILAKHRATQMFNTPLHELIDADDGALSSTALLLTTAHQAPDPEKGREL